MPKDVILQRNGEDIFPVTRYENILNKPKYNDALGIPILTQEMLDEIPVESFPKDYIKIPSESDIVNDNGDYLNILFSAIRKLQAEVSKLRNSFRYGISSYTGTDVAMSAIVSEYDDIEEDEPLWSIEEDDLSGIDDATVDFEAPFIPFTSEAPIDYDQSGFAGITGIAYTTDVVKNAYSEIDDTKLFCYLTVDQPNVKFYLDNETYIDVSALTAYRPTNERYNICCLVSRKMKVETESEEEYGKNYVWISVGYFNTNRTIAEGYYNFETGKLQKALYEVDEKYSIFKVELRALNIYKFNAYSKYQDFSHEIIQSKPDDSDYKYRAAHITIRSVATQDELESIEDRLLQDELVFQEDKKILWINGKNGLCPISGSGSSTDNGMTQQEMIEKLQELGIVYIDEKGLQLSDVSDITFINGDTGKKFKFSVNSEGELNSTELPDVTLSQRIAALSGTGRSVKTTNDIRGFVSKIFASEAGIDPTTTADTKLNSDRIKIGAIYCPRVGNTKFGCSHAFVELENTSDKDFPLDGCFLHYLHPNKDNFAQLDVEHLALDGILPAGGTYLIRGKQYADPKIDADVFINVDTFDKEWYINGELIDFVNDGTHCYGFALTYGDKVGDVEINAATVFITENSGNSNSPCLYAWNYIDSIVLNAHPNVTSGTWGGSYVSVDRPNMIIRNTFELDPAKQAYQALTKCDSSRYKFQNIDNDIQKLDLSEEYISFPNSADRCPVSLFTPMSSKCHKNVSTDKTKLDKQKPNMVTCSFGIDVYTTRAFNWISAGEFDEFVWIKNGSDWLKFESYKQGDGNKEVASGFPHRKEFSETAISAIYKRIVGDFPGDGSHYTSHKCIIQLVENAVPSKQVFTYMVGPENNVGEPDLEKCSAEYTFTLYPTSYTPRIYQTTDQQGFHWIEYQVWAAAADKLNEKIVAEAEAEQIIPILLNTGDMTQNGTRINEWLDYYNGGINLFKHLEQMNVVGNNDLCNTDVTILGTGDDPGKSNGYYFHVFYCYEVSEDNLPVILGDDNVIRYVPSLYYFDSTNYRFVMINSELTYENCKSWFNKRHNGQVINVYTGWCVPGEGEVSNGYVGTFTSVYTMIYNMLNGLNGKKAIAVCHEMPFTVITKDGLTDTQSVYENYRSLQKSGTTLIGSHTNQINGNDKVATHWLSRLLEHFNVKLCIGGHKHTYACTYPIRENYYYMLNGVKTNSAQGKMTMTSTLENDDTVTWMNDSGYNTSKLPYVPSGLANDATEASTNGLISPATVDANVTGGVTYFMCQATGYKLTSNKELPSNCQHFSILIPQTTTAEKPDNNQKYPMFSVIDMNNDNYEIQLIRIHNIKHETSHNFTQIDYAENAPSFEWAVIGVNSRYCTWSNSKNIVISI